MELQGEKYTAEKIVHEICIANTLNHIAKGDVRRLEEIKNEEVESEKGVTQKGEEVLREPDS